MSPEEQFETLVEDLTRVVGVTPPGVGSGFGSGALKVHNKIFAMLVRGQLVVKLPRRRVDALVASGAGTRFDANKGTPMKEWLALDPIADLQWSALAHEAMEFVNANVRS